MTIVLTVLLAVLKFVGWLLLFLLALLVALLILPVELRFAYQAGKPSLTAWYGPLHFTLWPRAAAKDTAAQHPATPQPAPAVQPSAEPALSKTQPAPAAAPAGAAAPAAQSPQASVAAKAAPTPAPAAEFTGEHPKSSALPFHISERIETALAEGMEVAYFDQRKSRVNSLLEEVLGRPLAAPYLIQAEGKRPKTRYGVNLAPEAIRFGAIDPATSLRAHPRETNPQEN